MKKKLSLSLSLIIIAIVTTISGCLKDDGTNISYPDVTAVSDTIFGTLKIRQVDTSGNSIVAWPHGTAVIKAIEAGTDVIATGTVNAEGNFTLILPATAQGIYFISLATVAYQQGGSIKATPETLRLMGSTQFKVEYTENSVAKTMMVSLCTLKTDFSVDKSYFYNFYDSDGTFKGTGAGAEANKFDWTFSKGWGLVESFKIYSTSAAFDSKSVNTPQSDAIWVN